MGARFRIVTLLLGVIGATLAATAIVTIFLRTPYAAGMSAAQKIFYFHVASAINMLLSFGVCAMAGAVYLATRKRHNKTAAISDAIAVATAEVGVMLGAMVLVTGPLWASKEWGTWWTFEPRLMLSLMVFLLFLAYLALRAYSGSSEFGRGVAAGMSLLGIPAIYFIHFAVERWGGNHPEVVFKGGLEDSSMAFALWLSVLAITFISCTLACVRVAIEIQRQQLDELFLMLNAKKGGAMKSLLFVLSIVLFSSILPFESAVASQPPKGIWQGEWTAGVIEREASDASTTLVVAYAALWVILILFVFRLAHSLHTLKRDAEALRRMIAEGAQREEGD